MYHLSSPEPEVTERNFVVSRDPAEWAHVERLLPSFKLVPPCPSAGQDYPSGFRAPTAAPGQYAYHVRRTRNHMLPVFVRIWPKDGLVVTKIKHADGDLFALRDDIDAFLKERYNMEFISQVAEVYGAVKYRGNFEEDFKEFLLQKGF